MFKKNSKFDRIDFIVKVYKYSKFDLKYIQFKNTVKTVLARSETKINGFLCFDHFLSASTGLLWRVYFDGSTSTIYY